MVSFVELPEELITRIGELVEPTDIFNLRLACRSLRDKTFYCFSTTFFPQRKYGFDRKGLDALLSVAQHPQFGNLVEELHIDLERWNHTNLHSKILDVGSKHGITNIKPLLHSHHFTRH